jgi:Uma2 family endonuclease
MGRREDSRTTERWTTTTSQPLVIGPQHAGVLMTPEEYDDHQDWEPGYRYEVINGVLIVSPPPLEAERDPNEQLGYWLRLYQEVDPQGKALDFTVNEQGVRTTNRRRADRTIWCGLGRLPDPAKDFPNVLVEFVSEGKENLRRDYEVKRDEYAAAGAQEYWIIDRSQRRMTVYRREGEGMVEIIVSEQDVYRTPLLPGFELPLARLLAFADRWQRRAPLEVETQ